MTATTSSAAIKNLRDGAWQQGPSPAPPDPDLEMTDPISTYEDGSRWKDVTLDPAGYSSLLDLTERPVVI
jgi:hypothetical protein